MQAARNDDHLCASFYRNASTRRLHNAPQQTVYGVDTRRFMPTDLDIYGAAKGRLSSFAVLKRENERLRSENKSVERRFDRLYEQAYAAHVQLRNLEAVVSKGALGGSTFATTQLLRLATNVLELLVRRPEQPCIALIPEALGCLSSCQIRDKHLYAAGQKLRRAISCIDPAVAQGRRIGLKPIERTAGQAPLDLRWLASVAGDLSWLDHAEHWQLNPLDLRWAAVAIDDQSLLLHRYAWQSAPIDLRYLTILTGDMDWLHIGAKQWQDTPMEIRLRAISCRDPTILWPRAVSATAGAVRDLRQAEVADTLPVLLPGLSPEEDLDISFHPEVDSDMILETEKLCLREKIMPRKSALDVDKSEFLKDQKVTSKSLGVAERKAQSVMPTAPFVLKCKAEAMTASTPKAKEKLEATLPPEKKSFTSVTKMVETPLKEDKAMEKPLAKAALFLETKKSVLLPARKTVPPVTKPYGGGDGAGEKMSKETSPLLPEAAPPKGSSQEMVAFSLKKSSPSAENKGDAYIVEKKLTPAASTVGKSSTLESRHMLSGVMGESVKQKKAPASSSVDKISGTSLHTPSVVLSATTEKKVAQAPSPSQSKIGSPLLPPTADVSKSVHMKKALAPDSLEKKILPSVSPSEPMEKEKTSSASELHRKLSTSVILGDVSVPLEKEKFSVASPVKSELCLSLHLSDGGKAVGKQVGLPETTEETRAGSPTPPPSAGGAELKENEKPSITISKAKQVSPPSAKSGPRKAPPFKVGKAGGTSDAFQPKVVAKSAAVGMSPSKLLEELRAKVGKEPSEKEGSPLPFGKKKNETLEVDGEATKPGEVCRTSKVSISKPPPSKKVDTQTGGALLKNETLPVEKVMPLLVKKGESTIAKGHETVKEFVQPPTTKVVPPKLVTETKEEFLQETAQESKSAEGGGKRKAPVSLVAPTSNTSAPKLSPQRKATPHETGEETKAARGVGKTVNPTLPSAAPKKKAAPIHLPLSKKNDLFPKKEDLPNSQVNINN